MENNLNSDEKENMPKYKICVFCKEETIVIEEFYFLYIV